MVKRIRVNRQKAPPEIAASAPLGAKTLMSLRKLRTDDGSHDPLILRISAYQQLLMKRGGFTHEQALETLADPDPGKKEPVAAWLRVELEKVRRGEKKVGAAPILNGEAVSRLIIADLAMGMLENCDGQPGEKLIGLFQELLNVDRHRNAVYEKSTPKSKYHRAASIDAQEDKVGLREMAGILSVSPATIKTWRESERYRSEVKWKKWVREDLKAKKGYWTEQDADRLAEWTCRAELIMSLFPDLLSKLNSNAGRERNGPASLV
jgi:hypothetical protein